MKSVLKIFILLLISAMFLQGCAEAKQDNQSSKRKATQATQENKIVKENVKRIGKPNYGYVDIPDNWATFKDVNATEPIIQYCDLSGTSIITLNAYKNPGSDIKDVATGIWQQMETQGAKDIKGATVKLGGNTALQVYGEYPDKGLILVTWVFEANDGYLHYVSVESPKEGILDFVNRTEKSYSLEK